MQSFTFSILSRSYENNTASRKVKKNRMTDKEKPPKKLTEEERVAQHEALLYEIGYKHHYKGVPIDDLVEEYQVEKVEITGAINRFFTD